MKLLVRDVASLFNVPEKTVYQWMEQEGLPAHKVNDQHRFNRTELLEWATTNHKQVPQSLLETDAETEIFTLAEALENGGVFHYVGGNDRESVLAEIVRLMPLAPDVDREFLYEVLLSREKVESTGIGGGIAIPHVRNPVVMHIPQPIITLSFLGNPVDFHALDNIPVHTLFSIVSPTLKAHLNLLSRIAFALHGGGFRDAVLQKADSAEIIRQAELIDIQVAEKSNK